MVGAFDLVNRDNLRGFLMSTQTQMGGFGKDDKSYPGKKSHKPNPYMYSSPSFFVVKDVLHSYMGLASLSLLGEPGLQTMNTSINLPTTGVERLMNKSVFWK